MNWWRRPVTWGDLVGMLLCSIPMAFLYGFVSEALR